MSAAAVIVDPIQGTFGEVAGKVCREIQKELGDLNKKITLLSIKQTTQV